ncbi:MAG: WG repeat-containing protein [Lewinellaceae bacterium]|nr:WG repeat-containing protein [Lewinellaceae bacterium]
MRTPLFFNLILAIGFFQNTPLTAQAPPEFVPYRQGNIWGYADRLGKLIIPPQFSKAGALSDSIALTDLWGYEWERRYKLNKSVATVCRNGRYGWLKADGSYVLEPTALVPPVLVPINPELFWLARCDSMNDEMRLFRIALFNRDLQQLSPFRYDWLTDQESEDGYNLGYWMEREIPVALHVWQYEPYGQFTPPDQEPDYLPVNRAGKAGYIRKDGSEAFAPIWDFIAPPDNEVSLAGRHDPELGILNYLFVSAGNTVLRAFDDIGEVDHCFSQGLLLVRITDGPFYYLDRTGNRATPEVYRKAFRFTRYGWAIVEDMQGRSKIIDRQGAVLLELENVYAIQPYHDGFLMQHADNLWYEHDRQFRQTGYLGLDGPPSDFYFAKTAYRIASLEGKQVLLDANDRVVMPFEFTYPIREQIRTTVSGDTTYFLEVHQGSKQGLYNDRLEEVVPCAFDYVNLYRDSVFILAGSNGKTQLFDPLGRLPIWDEFDEVRIDHGSAFGTIKVKKDGLWGSYAPDGKVILPVVYPECPPNSVRPDYPFVRLHRRDGWDFFNPNGQLLLRSKLDADHISSIENLDCADCYGIHASKNGTSFYARPDGTPLLPPQTYENSYLRDGYIVASKNKKKGIIRLSDRKEIVPFEYKHCYLQYGKIVLTRFDSTDRQLLDPQTGRIRTLTNIASIDPFSEGLARVHAGEACEDQNNFGFVDTNFQVVFRQQFSWAKAFAGGQAAARDAANRWGLIDRSGKWVVQPQFEKIELFRPEHRLIQVKAFGGGWGFIDRSGNWVLPPDLEEAYLECWNDRLSFAKGWRFDPASGLREHFMLDALSGRIVFQQKTAHPVKINLWSNNLRKLEDYPQPGQHSLLNPDGKFLLEACTYLSGSRDSSIFAIKDGRLLRYKQDGAELVGLNPPFKPIAAGWEVELVPLYNTAVLVDRQGKLLVPFAQNLDFDVYPEQQLVIGQQSQDNGQSDLMFCDKTGRILFQTTLKIGRVDPIDEQLVRISQDEKTGLINLAEGKEIIPPEFDTVELLPKQQLIRVFKEEMEYGYFDYLGRRYFSD